MKPYYGCEHQVLEYNSCCHNQRKFFYVDDLVKEIKKLIEPKFHDDSDKLREHKNKLNNVLLNLIEHLTNTEDKII